MELDISEIFNAFETGEDCSREYQNSVAKSGCADIGTITWDNALESDYVLVTEENRQEVIEHFAEYGAWDNLESWPMNELNALLLQEVTSEYQDFERCSNDWEEYQAESESGSVSGRLFEADGKVYFYIGI